MSATPENHEANGIWHAVITIDGPAASGKSTVARMVASRLAVPFVSSGLLYRAATRVALSGGVDLEDPRALLGELHRFDVRLEPGLDGNTIVVGGEDITGRLQTDEVDAAVSAVAKHPEVRTWVNDRLQEIQPPFVVEGRDMGTAVFPNARYKFYLTAPAEVRARRRLGERRNDLQSVAALLRRRDELDARQLQPADDAERIDTGSRTLEDVVNLVVERVTRAGEQ